MVPVEDAPVPGGGAEGLGTGAGSGSQVAAWSPRQGLSASIDRGVLL